MKTHPFHKTRCLSIFLCTLNNININSIFRLSKLPLLLERLIGALQEGNGNEEELIKLNRAYQLSKEIVNHVNEAAKMALNQARLEEIQRHLDQSNFERYN